MRNTRILTERGDLPERMVAEYRQQREALDTLTRAEASLQEALGEPR